MGKKFVLILASSMIAISMLSACSGSNSTAEPSVDSISKASTANYYEPGSVTGDAFIAFVSERKGAVSIATTNEDSSPNLATLIPGITPDGKYLTFSSAENQTIKNIEERKLAVFQFYNYQAKEEDKMKRNTGARAITKYDKDKQKELTAQYQVKEGTVLMEVVKVIPLG